MHLTLYVLRMHLKTNHVIPNPACIQHYALTSSSFHHNARLNAHAHYLENIAPFPTMLLSLLLHSISILQHSPSLTFAPLPCLPSTFPLIETSVPHNLCSCRCAVSPYHTPTPFVEEYNVSALPIQTNVCNIHN